MRRSRFPWKAILAVGLVAIVALAVAVVVMLPRRTGVEGWSERVAPRANSVVTDAAVAAAFAPGAPAYPAAAYEAAARYAFEGWAAYRSPDFARAHYPGAKSENGRSVDGFEGFARMFPLAAAWLASGRPAEIRTASGTLDLADAFARGLAAGTDPSQPGYWGDVRDFDQRIVEAADVALGLWLSRDRIWAKLDAPTRARVVAWLERTLASEPYEGNWQLFPMVVHRSLAALGVDVSRWNARMESSWDYFRQFHRGSGWFVDPPHGFDYYNAWSIHYSMFWLARIDPSFDREFVASTVRDFARFYVHFFGPQGQPLMGRSVCYRTAAPLPLLTAQSLAPGAVPKGEAMRAMDLTWSVFVGRGVFADGAVTQGFCGTDLSTLATYSGPASCLWALRSLVVAFALDRELDLFATARAPLPVERGDFSVTDPATGWTIAGERATGRVVLTIADNPEGAGPPLQPYGAKARALEWLLHKPRRPDNTPALYQRRTYASDAPVARCESAAR
jgi:hypothetical protein